MTTLTNGIYAGDVLLFGGGYPPFYNDTWVFDGISWTQLSPATSPPGMFGASLATLTTGPDAGDVVLFGGNDNGDLLNETWIFDGANWTQLSPATSPAGRYFASMTTLATGPDAGDVLLFGGDGYSSYNFGDTWIFDGTNWTQLSPATSPPGTSYPSSATMTTGTYAGDTVLFGGNGASGLLNDTWVFDGTTWTQLSPATSPPARTVASMTTLTIGPDAGDVVLFGGGGVSGYLNDTWVFDGTTWTQLSPATSPPGRFGASLASLTSGPDTGDVVLFGGYDNSGVLGDTWLFTNPAAVVVNITGTQVYGGPPTFTADYSADPPGTAATVTGSLTCATSATPFSPVAGGPYTVSDCSGLSSTLGPITYTYGTLVVSPDASTTSLGASSSSAVFGQQLTLTATVSAAAPGSGVPTGTVTFFDGTTALGSVSLNASGQATLTTQGLLPGTHTALTAVYSGDPNYLTSTSSASQVVVGYTSCISGTHTGALTVTAGEVICITGAQTGAVSVQAGGALAIVGGHVTGAIQVSRATAFLACGATITGALSVQGVTGPVIVGDVLYDGAVCAGNTQTGAVSLSENTGPVALGSSTVTGAVSITANVGGPTVIEGNRITGALTCSSNTPPPTDDGYSNTVTGARSGQCSAAGF
jgi:hypothetical protein